MGGIIVLFQPFKTSTLSGLEHNQREAHTQTRPGYLTPMGNNKVPDPTFVYCAFSVLQAIGLGISNTYTYCHCSLLSYHDCKL